MSISPVKEPRVGDYVFSCGQDTEQAIADAVTVLTAQGCKQFRPEPLPDGRVIVHGYLRAA